MAKKRILFVDDEENILQGIKRLMIGIPKELFTPIFAMSRVAGWTAHRIEEIIQGKLIRPSYVSSLEDFNSYIPLEKR